MAIHSHSIASYLKVIDHCFGRRCECVCVRAVVGVDQGGLFTYDKNMAIEMSSVFCAFSEARETNKPGRYVPFSRH